MAETSAISRNIYTKLQAIRCELQALNPKKSGHNKFAGYDYYELADFIPHVNNLMLKHKITSVLQYEDTKATLVIVNCEKPDEVIVFMSPMVRTQIKGCNEIQALGAVESYVRRYLWLACLELVESNAVDAGAPVEEAIFINSEQVENIKELLEETQSDFKRFLKYMKVAKLEEIKTSDFQKAVQALNAKREQVMRHENK